jgi:hypothetical protein
VKGQALTFGAGFLSEALFLVGRGWTVDALETPASVERRKAMYSEFEGQSKARILTSLDDARTRYRLITVTHVLEFIENPRERKAALRELATRVAANGNLLLSLRGWSDVMAARRPTPRGDGIITGLGTWTRGYTVDEARALVQSAGLLVRHTPHTPRSKTPEQVRFVCALP